MKQKNNIFEELNKMRNLIHAKAGTVISEQADPGFDIATIMGELDKTYSDESKIVNIIKKYKDKASFKSFVDQYKAKSGKDFGVDVFRAIQPYNDKTEWNDMKTHLGTMGITLGNTAVDPRKGASSATFAGLDTPVAAPAAGGRTPEAINNINAVFCNVRGGKITSGYYKDKPWSDYKTQYTVTAEEEAAAQKTCPTVQTGIVTGPANRGNSQVVTDYSKKIQTSLGSSPTGQISDNELEKILTQLNGEVSGEVNQTVQGLPTTADGQPDLEKILASL